MNIFTLVIHHDVAYSSFGHCACKSIPGAEILPRTVESHHFYLGFLLNHRIIETDLG